MKWIIIPHGTPQKLEMLLRQQLPACFCKKKKTVFNTIPSHKTLNYLILVHAWNSHCPVIRNWQMAKSDNADDIKLIVAGCN